MRQWTAASSFDNPDQCQVVAQPPHPPFSFVLLSCFISCCPRLQAFCLPESSSSSSKNMQICYNVVAMKKLNVKYVKIQNNLAASCLMLQYHVFIYIFSPSVEGKISLLLFLSLLFSFLPALFLPLVPHDLCPSGKL